MKISDSSMRFSIIDGKLLTGILIIAIIIVAIVVWYTFKPYELVFGVPIIIKNESEKSICKLVISGRYLYLEFFNISPKSYAKSRFKPRVDSGFSVHGYFEDGTLIYVNEVGYTTSLDTDSHVFIIENDGRVSYESND